MEQQQVEKLFVPMWTQFLAYGRYESQEASMYALRSHGHEVVGEGYWEDFYWLWRPPGKTQWCRIDPCWVDTQNGQEKYMPR